MRKLLLGSVALLVTTFAAGSVPAAEMLMLEQPGCPWCARFNAEIAPAWPHSAEGKRAPLRRIDITEPWPPDLAGIQKERFTPTFILLDDGIEVGRLRGYAGDEFFWYLVGELVAKLPPGPHLELPSGVAAEPRPWDQPEFPESSNEPSEAEHEPVSR